MATITMSTKEMMIVPICASVFLFHQCLRSTEQRPNERCQNQNGKNKSEYISGSAKHASKLVNYKGNNVGKTTFPTDCGPGPFAAVHFALDGTNCGKTRSTQKVENQE